MRKLRVGDWVEVRSKEEILATLDKKGRIEGLPFMPQMFQHCGQRFQVFKRAHKTCDWVYTVKGRSLPNGIHLNLRCDGEAYGGCQSACLLYWKEAWLKPVSGSNEAAVSSEQQATAISSSSVSSLPSVSSCAVEDVLAGTRTNDTKDTDGWKYTCQGTDVLDFTKPLAWWDCTQYLEDYTSGNVTLRQLLQGFFYAGYYNLSQAGIGLGGPLRWLYEKVTGNPWPRATGKIPVGQHTPTLTLNLQPGEFVQVKSFEEILATLDTSGKNRGLSFDAEMMPYCGGTYRVKTRVGKYVNEKTGKLETMKKDAIIMEDVWCRSRYSYCRMFCPRSLYSWWHEIWLERVTEGNDKK